MIKPVPPLKPYVKPAWGTPIDQVHRDMEAAFANLHAHYEAKLENLTKFRPEETKPKEPIDWNAFRYAFNLGSYDGLFTGTFGPADPKKSNNDQLTDEVEVLCRKYGFELVKISVTPIAKGPSAP